MQEKGNTMTKMTKAALAQIITERNDALRAKYASKAANAQKRIAVATAFYASDRAQTAMLTYGVDVDALYKLCDKSHDRFVKVTDALIRGDLTLRDDRDQNRYTFGLIRSAIAANAANAKLTKSDILATGSKRDDASEFVTVSRRIMSDSTAERQTGIAQYVLTALGVATRVRNLNNKIDFDVNVKSAAYKRFVELLAVA